MHSHIVVAGRALSISVAALALAACPPPVEPPPDDVDCGPEPTGDGTEHGGSVDADETWGADGSPHLLPYDTAIYATLTLDTCAVVKIAAGHFLTVRGGALVGKPGARIVARDAEPFAAIGLVGGTMDLEGVVIEGGGDPLNTLPYLAGTLDLTGAAGPATQAVARLVDVEVRDSASNGIVVRDGGGFTDDSRDLVVTGAAQFPVSIWARAVGTLPTGTYTGNATDEILLPALAGNEAIVESTTMHARGVPYLVGHETSLGDLRVQAVDGVATLTIEAGVTLRFKRGAVLHVEQATSTDDPARGALIARGTEDAPIVFTSAEASPAPGDWLGIWYGLAPSATNVIDYARVEYAGGASVSGSDSCVDPPEVVNDAAIRVRGPVAASFVTNTTIANSASNGIDRGFRSDTKPSFLPSNSFSGVAKCTETYPRDVSGACPDPVPCPTE
ncbi:MAG: hypothetical protein HYS27_21760 [Deltaproteobacteria bacterium]|nr:hypothetical protein [Deltaproteobacteria bacterium]